MKEGFCNFGGCPNDKLLADGKVVIPRKMAETKDVRIMEIIVYKKQIIWAWEGNRAVSIAMIYKGMKISLRIIRNFSP